MITRPEPKDKLLLAEETCPDLLVMGSVGRTGLPLILMGSLEQKVVCEMPCSVITAKSKEGIPELPDGK
jgi:nucleotide-binding universal stress UspA family protein